MTEKETLKARIAEIESQFVNINPSFSDHPEQYTPKDLSLLMEWDALNARLDKCEGAE